MSTSESDLATAAPSSLVEPARILDDPRWERSALGPFVRRGRSRLFSQLRGSAPNLDVVPTLLRAYDGVPYYQALFRRLALGRDDLRDPRAFAAIPPTTRAELAREGIAPFLFHPIRPSDEALFARAWLGRTSGSTGAPVAYLRDPRTVAWFCAFLDFTLAYTRRREFEPRSPRGVLLLDTLGHRPEYDVALPLLHGVRLSKRSITRGDRALRETLLELRPRIVTGDPDSLAPLARLDLPPRARPSLVLSGAFALPSSLRQAIAEATGAAVVEYYATQEISVVGLSCRLGQGFHLLSGATHVSTTSGELLLTPVAAPSFTLIRYAPGDLGELSALSGACACGLRGPLITALLGRTNVHFVTPTGSTFAPGPLAPLLARLPVREHVLEQLTVDRYVLRVSEGRALATEHVAEIERRLSELAGATVELLAEHVTRALHPVGEKPKPYVAMKP